MTRAFSIRVLLLGTLTVVNFAGARTAKARGDYFDRLENLTIGTAVKSEILKESTGKTYATVSGVTKDVYMFRSERFSLPHILHLVGGRAVFIQLTIPFSLRDEYKDRMVGYGPPEEMLEKTRSEVMHAFPSRGVSFIINDYSGNVVKIQRFPPSGNDNFEMGMGRNFGKIETQIMRVVKKDKTSPKNKDRVSLKNAAQVIFYLLVGGPIRLVWAVIFRRLF